jgi:hypothetical protein
MDPVSITFNSSVRTGNVSVKEAIAKLAGYTSYVSGKYRKGSDYAEVCGSLESRSFIRRALTK